MTNSKRKSSGDQGLFLVLTLILVLPFAAWYGFVVETLWRWFVAPLGIPQIGLWEAAGLFLLARLLTFNERGVDETQTPAERFVSSVATALLLPAMTLGFAAIYHGLGT